MPRQIRRTSKTNIYHVMMRGINKESIFDTTYKKSVLKRLLKNYLNNKLHKIYAYCIMDNHYHLVIEAQLDDLSRLMHLVNSSYAKYYNDNYKRIGPVFNNRFKSECVESNEYLIAAIKYVHDNPVKARKIKNSKDYHWSSSKGYSNTKQEQLVSKEVVQEVRAIYMSEKEYFDSFLKNIDKSFIDIKEIEGFVEGIEFLNQLKSDHRNIDKKVIIKETLLKTDLSHRQISKALGVSLTTISNVKKQM